MKLSHRIESIFVVSALLLCVAGCKSTKPQVNSYTGLMSGRGNVPPAYAEIAPIPRTAAELPAAPATYQQIGDANAYAVDAPTFAEPASLAEEDSVGDIDGDLPLTTDAPATEPKSGLRELPPVPEAPAIPAGEIYVVKSGDSLSKIAAAYGVKTADIMALNPRITTPDKIVVGQKITLPADAKLKASAPASTGTKSSAPKKSSIAKESVPADGKYVVRSGDSLWIIARRFDLTVDALRSMNNLSSDSLQVGQELIVKGGAAPAAPAAVATPAEAAPVEAQAAPVEAQGDAAVVTEAAVDPMAITEPVVTEAIPQANVYPVKIMEGDTLEGLASAYDTTVEAILKANPQIQSNADLRPDMMINMAPNQQ